jgi:hypothetical protein
VQDATENIIVIDTGDLEAAEPDPGEDFLSSGGYRETPK